MADDFKAFDVAANGTDANHSSTNGDMSSIGNGLAATMEPLKKQATEQGTALLEQTKQVGGAGY